MFQVFGVLQVNGPDEGLKFSAEKPRRMLLLLLLRANQWVPDSELIDAVWPSGAPASAMGNIKSYVSQVRQLLAPFDICANRVERQPGAYRLNVGRTELDTMVFEDLVERGRIAPDAEQAVRCLVEALALWRGEPFESFEVEAAKFELARLTELRWSARNRLADAYVSTGRVNEAVGLLRAMTVEDPFKEQAWLRLMKALHDSGRRAEALIAYQAARRVMVDELGIEPGADLQGLYELVLRDDLRLRPRVTPPPAAVPQVAVRRPRTPVRVVYVAGLVALLIAALVASDRTWPGTASLADSPVTGSATTAAERYGWGGPSHAAEFATGIDGDWVVLGPQAGRGGKGRFLPEQVSVRDGVLTISGLPNGDTGFLTRRPGSLYGRWEARIRVPAGCQCYRPLLTLWPDANDPPAGGEIVYFESLEAERRSADFFLASPKIDPRLHGRRDIDLTVWNHFAVEWTADHVTGYVNGEKWFHTQDRTVLPPRPMRPNIKLDLVSTEQMTPAAMEVDWIRHYPITGGTP